MGPFGTSICEVNLFLEFWTREGLMMPYSPPGANSLNYATRPGSIRPKVLARPGPRFWPDPAQGPGPTRPKVLAWPGPDPGLFGTICWTLGRSGPLVGLISWTLGRSGP